MFLTITQIFKPPGITGASGSPNLYRTLDNSVRKFTWRDYRIGGLGEATIELFEPFEDTANLQSGLWLIFGCRGGYLSTAAAAGTVSLNLNSASYVCSDITQNFSEFNVGDIILISDGINTDMMSVASVSGLDFAIIGLAASVNQGSIGLLNSYGIGTKVVRLMYQGYMYNRPRDASFENKYSISAQGFFSRFNNVLVNANIVKQDCADSVKGILSEYTTTLPFISFNASNFATTNGIACNIQAQEQSIVSVLQNLLTFENGYTAGAVWSVWVDAQRVVHHGQLPTSGTATRTFNIQLQNALGDVCGALHLDDQDLTQLLNMVIVYGGQMPNGQQLRILVQELASITQYGFYEGVLQNVNLIDNQTAATWAAAQLAVKAYPRTTGSLPLLETTARITPRDYIQIVGFTDSSSLFGNITDIEYIVDANTLGITARISIDQPMPDLKEIMDEVASEKSQKSLSVAPGTSLADAFVVSGFDLVFGP